jgi:hypothetical protein
MVQTCRTCFRVNPTEALYCYHDGTVLDCRRANGEPLNTGRQPFPSQFVFPSGRICQNFDQLALACQEQWTEALSLLQQGYLENFLSGLGRTDLALAARAAAQLSDPDRGLDEFLDKLPSQVLEPPRLAVTPREINLGQLRVGQDQHRELHIANKGMRLLHGSIRCENSPWLSLGQAPGQSRKLFETRGDQVVPFHVRGQLLRAGIQPLEGVLLIDSNGGTAVVRVRAEVPLTPFPEGVLAGATTPRQVAQKAKNAPKEAGGLFEKGAVAEWYRQNGWTYPVPGPAASGLAAVQQFFEALGLTKPPKVAIGEWLVSFAGEVGDRLEHAILIRTEERRPVYAFATSDQGWLQVGRPHLMGATVAIPLVVLQVPNNPGELLRARVLVTANGNQRFTVDVMLAVGADAGRHSSVPPWIPEVIPVLEEVLDAVPVVPAETASRQPRSR